MAWEREYGVIGDGLVLHHVCGNKGCVNVAHLQILTQSDHQRLHQTGRRYQRPTCRKGHALTPDNTYVYPPLNGRVRRTCRTCKTAYSREWKRARQRSSRQPMEGKVS